MKSGYTLVSCLLVMLTLMASCILMLEHLRMTEKSVSTQLQQEASFWRIVKTLQIFFQQPIESSCIISLDDTLDPFSLLENTTSQICLVHQRNISIRYLIAKKKNAPEKIIYVLAKEETNPISYKFQREEAD